MGVIGFLLMLLLALFIWFCCSIQDRLYRQKKLSRVNKSEIGILRKYIDVLREKLDITTNRIPTTIHPPEDNSTRARVLRSFPTRVSSIFDPNINDVIIEVQDNNDEIREQPALPTIKEQIEHPSARVEVVEDGASAVPAQVNIITARKRSCGKVMFLHLSVILFTEGGGVMMP